MGKGLNRYLNAVGGASFGALFGAICDIFIAYAGFSIEVVSLFFITCVVIGAGFGLTGYPRFWK